MEPLTNETFKIAIQLFKTNIQKSVISNGQIETWDTSNVTDMSSAFMGMTKFNRNLNSWNISKVTNMKCMFKGCSRYDKLKNTWNLNNVSEKKHIFKNTYNKPHIIYDNFYIENEAQLLSAFMVGWVSGLSIGLGIGAICYTLCR
jgi:surface protein